MSFLPLHDRVAIKPIETDEKTIGGIIIPDSAKEKPVKGEVIAVGSGNHIDGKLVSLDVKVGDKVLYAKWSGSEIKIDNEKILVMKESDILGIVCK